MPILDASDISIVTIAEIIQPSLRPPAASDMLAMPGFARDDQGRPRIGLNPESLYAYGHLIRLTEQLILDQFSRGLVSGTTHTCLGQEIAAISVVRAMDHSEDAVLSNHRNHGHFLTYSGDFLGLVAEIMGREAGVCRGRGGSQHLAWQHFHSNGVQAGMTGISAGLALARKKRGSGGLVAAMIGDGTLGQGLLYESMNLASVWQVPLLVVVENNGIAQTTYTRDTIGGSIKERGAAFGFATWHLADDDPSSPARSRTSSQRCAQPVSQAIWCSIRAAWVRTAKAMIFALVKRWPAFAAAILWPRWAAN